MRRARPHIAEGRRESALYRAGIYALLIVGAVPVLLPLYWLVVASLKTKDRVEAYPPDWLPVVPRTFLRVADQDVPVKVLDTGEASGTLVARVKLVPDAEAWLRLPARELKITRTEEWYATLEGVRRRVLPRGLTADGSVEVELPGLHAEATVPLGAINRVEETMIWWQVLGIELPVRVCGELPADGLVRIAWEGPSAAIPVVPKLFDEASGVVIWRGRRLPARLAARQTSGGFCRVELTCPTDGLEVPASELRPQTQVHFTAPIEGRLHTVRVLSHDTVRGEARVEILDRARTVLVPANSIERVERLSCAAELLGQQAVVEPLMDVTGLVALTPVPVQVPGVLVVACDQLRTERPLRPQWKNYALAWREQAFGRFVINTLFIAALVVLGSVLSCGLVGYAFARLEFRGREALFLLLLATLMVPGQVTSIPTFVLFARLGWLDSYKPLIVPAFLASSAFFVFLYRQYMRTIPSDLEDAARIDGCGPLQIWWLIIMPLCRPIVVTVAVFAFIGVWNDFLGPLLYINSDEKQTVALGLQTFKSGFQYDDPQLLMAASVMMMLPSLLLFFVAQRAFLRGVVVSGLKG
jgi:ABC-type glycerol-3-phosphate transport system permease component